MKTNNYFFYIASFILSLFVLPSCDKDDESNDTTFPEIELLAPAEGAHLQIGKSIHFEANFSDDIMLGTYKIEIHHNFDDHGHDSKSGMGSLDEKGRFRYQGTWSLEGQRNKHEHHHDIIIPAGAAEGKYHLMVYCTDKAGNESYIARGIILTNEEAENHDH